MANFFYTGADGGHSAINLDLVRLVNRDQKAGTATIYFDLEQKIVLEGDLALEFMDVLTRLKSEANLAVELIKREKAAKNAPKKPQPPSRGSKGARGSAWS